MTGIYDKNFNALVDSQSMLDCMVQVLQRILADLCVGKVEHTLGDGRPDVGAYWIDYQCTFAFVGFVRDLLSLQQKFEEELKNDFPEDAVIFGG